MPTVTETVEVENEADKKQGGNKESLSEEESDEIDNELLIDTMVAENRKNWLEGAESPEPQSYEKIVVNPCRLYPVCQLSKYPYLIWMQCWGSLWLLKYLLMI